MLFCTNGLRVLAIGAHPDDIEIGAGGFIYRLVSERQAVVKFLICTAGIQHPHAGHVYQPVTRRQEAIRAAAQLGVTKGDVEVLEFEDCNLHTCGHKLIHEMEKRLFTSGAAANYDLVLSHAGEDSHSDHRCVHESTVSAARGFEGVLLFYQAPSTKPNRFTPSFFVSLDRPALHAKDMALQSHASQRDKEFAKLLRTEGMAKSWALFLRMPSECFEAFEINKAFWSSQPAGQDSP